MSMEEKFGAVWLNVAEDDSAKVVFEEYLPLIEKLHVIFRQVSGNFVPCSYMQKSDHQWSLPLWSQENDKAVMPTLESAKTYLHSFASNT